MLLCMLAVIEHEETLGQDRLAMENVFTSAGSGHKLELLVGLHA
jgi:hypothetical protein